MGREADEPRHRRQSVGAGEEEGLEPTKEWVKDLVDEIIAEEFASPDLELVWLDEDDGDPKMEAVLEGRLKLGAVTLNEMRDLLGLDPYANPAADRPMVLTATGYVPIEANARGEGQALQPRMVKLCRLSQSELSLKTMTPISRACQRAIRTVASGRARAGAIRRAIHPFLPFPQATVQERNTRR